MAEELRSAEAEAEAEEERGLLEILGHAPLILFAVDGDGRLCLAEGGLVSRPDLPRPAEGQTLMERFAGTEIGDALARALRGERFEKLLRLDVGDFEVHYFPWQAPDGRPGTVGLVVDVTERERALRGLRESEARLRIISDRASEMIAEQGPDARFLFVSRSFAEALGYGPDELLGRNAFDVVDASLREPLRERLEAALDRGESVRVRVPVRRRDGSTLWLEAVSQAFLAADGARHTVSIMRDVTQEREEEERRERRLALLERASEIGGELVACASPQLEAQLARSLAETARLAGADRAVIILLSEAGEEIRHLWWSADPDDDEPPDRDRLVEMARALVIEPDRTLHLAGIEAAQHPLLAERGNRAALAFPLRTGDDASGFLGLTRTREARGWDEDETEVLRLLADALARGFVRLAAEHAVEDRARMQTAVTGLAQRLLGVDPERLDAEIQAGLALAGQVAGVDAVMLVAWDPQDQRFLEMHQRYAPGLPALGPDELRRHPWMEARMHRGELLALPSPEHFPPEALATLRPGTRALLVAPIEITPRFVALLAGWDARARAPWSAAELERFRFVGGLLAGALRRRQTGRAVRESEEQLTQSQKMETVGRLAGNIAHDFNNLLTVIAGNAEVVSHELPSPHQQDDALAIRRAADRAAQLTRDLLAFSRSRTGVHEVVSLNDVVRGVTALLERTLGDDIDLDLRLRPEAGRVDVDADRLRQIVVNLALNGRDAMPKGGRLSIDTRRVRLSARQAERLGVRGPGAHAVLEVRDEGEGMDDAIRSRAFEPFFTTKRSGTAVGLGLSIAYSTMKELGGAVDIESASGRGTCVRLFFPAADDEADAKPSDPA